MSKAVLMAVETKNVDSLEVFPVVCASCNSKIFVDCSSAFDIQYCMSCGCKVAPVDWEEVMKYGEGNVSKLDKQTITSDTCYDPEHDGEHHHRHGHNQRGRGNTNYKGVTKN